MKVVSKLVDLELHIGRIEKKERLLLVHSDPDRSMPATIQIDPYDVLEIAKRMIMSSGFWGFCFRCPGTFGDTGKSCRIAKQQIPAPGIHVVIKNGIPGNEVRHV